MEHTLLSHANPLNSLLQTERELFQEKHKKDFLNFEYEKDQKDLEIIIDLVKIQMVN